ncbi:MAG: glycosyltransferase family 39 protein, partial [Bacteroidia bacterium]|nr:glycosyltransferase family 39 protein [Bacteroidia bacterium]
MTPEKKTGTAIVFIALLSVGLHLIFLSNLEYHRDELLYFSLGLHPDFGYASVPPLIGWVAWIMQNIFGYSVFAVRLFPALIGGVEVILVSELAKELGGNKYARILAATGMIISVFGLRTFLLFQPVHIDLLFWTLTIYLIIKYINSENPKYLIWFGIVAGLSLLNKYLIGLLFIIILVVILFTRYRNVLSNKIFWFGIAAGTIIFLPNLIWQIANGLPVINHLSELAENQLVNVNRSAFLTEQIIMPGASSFLTIAGLLYILFNKQQKKFRFLGVIVIAVIVTLMMMRGKSYYTQGVFPFLISAGAVYYESIFRKWYTRSAFIVLLVLLTVFILPFGLPVFKTKGLIEYFNTVESKYGFDFGRTFEDGSKHSLPQDYADMLGWEELTALANGA